MDVGVFFEKGPVEPVALVVVAVAVVVAVLGAADLVAHQDHGHADGHQGYGEEVFCLAVAEGFGGGVGGGALVAAVPAQVVVGAIAVLFAVGFVVLEVVGD